MYLHTAWNRGTARDQMDYIDRSGEQTVYDRTGQAMSDAEKEDLLADGDRMQYHRRFLISPDPQADISDTEMWRETRKTMNEFVREEGRETADYAYSIHKDTDVTHAHVIVTGEKTDLEMSTPEIARMKKDAANRMEEPSLQQSIRNDRQQLQESYDKAAALTHEATHSHGADVAREAAKAAVAPRNAPSQSQSDTDRARNSMNFADMREKVQELKRRKRREREREQERDNERGERGMGR